MVISSPQLTDVSSNYDLRNSRSTKILIDILHPMITLQRLQAFDPDFYPINIEKFDSHSLSGISTRTLLDPLQWSADAEVLSTNSSFGSVIVLDFCDHQFTTVIHDNDYVES